MLNRTKSNMIVPCLIHVCPPASRHASLWKYYLTAATATIAILRVRCKVVSNTRINGHYLKNTLGLSITLVDNFSYIIPDALKISGHSLYVRANIVVLRLIGDTLSNVTFRALIHSLNMPRLKQSYPF